MKISQLIADLQALNPENSIVAACEVSTYNGHNIASVRVVNGQAVIFTRSSDDVWFLPKDEDENDD